MRPPVETQTAATAEPFGVLDPIRKSQIPPLFENEERNRIAKTLYVIAGATLPGVLVLLIYRLAFLLERNVASLSATLIVTIATIALIPLLALSGGVDPDVRADLKKRNPPQAIQNAGAPRGDERDPGPQTRPAGQRVMKSLIRN